MKKINYLLLSIIICAFAIINVEARNYVEVNQYDFVNGWETVNLGLSGYKPIIKEIEPLKDGVLLIGYYKEENSKWADNNYTIPGSDGGGVNGAPGGTSVRDHAKIVKLDLNYNKIWEKNLYVKGNWANAEEIADTVSTNILAATELSDKSVVVVGYTWGLILPDAARNDDFNAIFARYDKDGNEMYNKTFIHEGFNDTMTGSVKEAIAVKALSDGGYVIKYAAYIKGVTDYSDINNIKNTVFYVVYDNANNIKEIIPENNISNLYNYSYLEQNAVIDLLNIKDSGIDENYWSERYLGTDISGDVYYIAREGTKGQYKGFFNVVNIYDKNKSQIKKQIELVNSFTTNVPSPIVMSNTGDLVVGNALYSKDGNLLYKYYEEKKDNRLNSNLTYGDTAVLENGHIIMTDRSTNTIKVLKQKDGNGDFANVIIDGEKIGTDLGIFLENDRTYINLNNLCSVMNCNYSRGEKNNNMLIIKFPLFHNNKNKMIDPSVATTSLSNVERYIKYTITHEIGSKKYSSYLEIEPDHLFVLKSPTFDSNSVDVTSKEIDGQIFVPLRFISEAMGRYVGYEPKGDDGKPTITISALGEGEFYEKYKAVVSFNEYVDGDTSVNINENTSIDLKCDGNKLYAYGYDIKNNRIVSKENTVFVFLSEYVSKGFFEYNGQNENKYPWNKDINYFMKGDFESSNNEIRAITSILVSESSEEPFCGQGKDYTFWVVSNIEGYPFLKLVNLKAVS